MNSDQQIGDSSSTEISLADIDGDGDIDAFVSVTGKPLIWRNTGKGRFETEVIELEGAWQAVALDDLDGDGDVDAVLVSDNSPDVVLLNDSHGQFTDSGQRLNEESPVGNQVSIADLNGDQSPDLFFATMGHDQVWLNDGKGNFRSSGQVFPESRSSDVGLKDIDGDQRPDAVISTYGSNKVWRSLGDGRFEDTNQQLGVEASSAVALGDIDGDGDIDAVFSNNSTTTDNVWTNNGEGVFTKLGALGDAAISPDVALADVDNDNDLDVVTTNWANEDGSNPSSVCRLWLNDGTGMFPESVALGEHELNTSAVIIRDIDGDQDKDIILVNWRNQPDRIFFNELN